MDCYRATLRDTRNGFETNAFRNHPSDELALHCWTKGLCSQDSFRSRRLYGENDSLVIESGSGWIELIKFENITTGEVLLNENLCIHY